MFCSELQGYEPNRIKELEQALAEIDKINSGKMPFNIKKILIREAIKAVKSE